LLGITGNCVGLKAKTPEGLNSENAALAHVVVLLEGIQKKSSPRRSTRRKRAP
jgi:2-C-methyl-D-erythritol 2,4-cyclodiphosphate synthase